MTSASGSRDAWPLPPYRRCSSRHPFLRRRPADGAWPRRPRPFVEWWYPWWDTLGAGEGLLGLPRGRRGYVKGAVVVQICETLFYIVQDAICGVRPQSKGKPGRGARPDFENLRNAVFSLGCLFPLLGYRRSWGWLLGITPILSNSAANCCESLQTSTTSAEDRSGHSTGNAANPTAIARALARRVMARTGC